jgi:signal transduction histidine kinase
VSDAKAANMLLLADTHDPSLCVSQKPTLSVAVGLGPVFANEIEPRSDGLTYRVLRAQSSLAVTVPEEPPGIHPLALEQGVQAYLCLPMTIHGDIVGVLFVHYAKPHSFSETESEMLALFANQAALAIENTRLMGQLKNQLRYVAHAATTPLHSLGLLIEQLHDGTDSLRVERSYLAIKSTIADLDTMIKNSLALARHEQGALQPDPDQIDLNKLVMEIVDLFALEAEDEGVDLQAVPSETPALVWVDGGMIAQVLHNLIKNALYAFPTGWPRVKTVQARVERRPSAWAIVVRDSGRGIPQEERLRIFEPFYPGSKRTGIGLYISREIARLHDGDLELRSQVDQGSAFSLTLPTGGGRTGGQNLGG